MHGGAWRCVAVRGGAWRCVAVRGGRRTTLIEHENRYGQVSFLPFFRVFFFAAGFRFLDGLAAAGPEAPLSLLADAAEATAGPAPDALASLCREDVDGVKVTGTWGSCTPATARANSWGMHGPALCTEAMAPLTPSMMGYARAHATAAVCGCGHFASCVDGQ